jgi:hypothetical protein
MNIRKTFYLVTMVALVAVAVMGYLLVPSFNSTSVVSAQESASKADGEIATPEMLRYALDFKSDDMAKSFSALNQLPCTEVDDTDLSGKSFKAGVYCLSSAQLAGQLVVDAESDPSAIFIFKVAGSLNTKNGSSIELANNAQASNIFFVTGDGATVREGTNFRGSIFAKNSVTVNDGAMVEGRLISLNSKVSAPQSVLAPQQFGTLEICKTIDVGNPAAASILGSTFQFTVTGVAGTITIGPITQLGAAGRVCTGAISVPAGAATITELNARFNTGGTLVQGGFQLFDVNVLSPAVPAGTLGSTIGVVNLPARTIGANIVAGGGIQGQLTVELVNRAAITGFIEICKNAATIAGALDPDVTGFFTFRVQGVFAANGTTLQEFTVPVGQCTNAITVVVGDPGFLSTGGIVNTNVSELGRTGFFLESVNTLNVPSRILSTAFGTCLSSTSSGLFGLAGNTVSCPGGGTALVQVVTGGGVANETVVNFVNRAAPGLVKVCKIAGPGIPLGTLFRFQVEGTGSVLVPATVDPPVPASTNPAGLVNQFVNVPAGSPATGGSCVFVPGLGGTGDAAGLQTFVNGTAVRVFELGTVDFPGSTFAFDTLLTGEDIRVSRIRTSSTFAPAGGTSRLSATFTPNPNINPGTRAAQAGPPALPAINFLGAGAVVARAGIVEVEFTNFAFTPTLLKVCKIAGTGITPNTSFTFDVAVVSPTSTGGVIGGTADLFPAFTTSVTVNAGPAAQGGNCTFVPTTGTGTLLGGAFDIGSTVTITERGTSVVTAITSSTSTTVAAGAATGGLSVNLGTRAATLFGTGGLVAGVNIVTFTNSTVAGPGPGPGDVKVPFDFNGDGRSDISVYRPSNGTWYINNSGTESKMAATQFGEATDKTVPADYDGDMKADIANFRPSNGGWYILGSKNGLTSMQFGAPGDIPVPADFDADGKADVAVFRPSNGTWYVQRSTEGFLGVQFGQSGDQPVTADFDGDGKSDMAVFRPSNGTWYINQSGEGFKAIQFGLAGDKAVPADFDGDKRADVAVFRSGTWYVMGSKAGFMGVQFGQAGDTPVAADYDGDGKADMSVFRSGMWHVLQSKDGYTGIQFGMNTDTPVPASFLR